jgi:hypothetical protein
VIRAEPTRAGISDNGVVRRGNAGQLKRLKQLRPGRNQKVPAGTEAATRRRTSPQINETFAGSIEGPVGDVKLSC